MKPVEKPCAACIYVSICMDRHRMKCIDYKGKKGNEKHRGVHAGTPDHSGSGRDGA